MVSRWRLQREIEGRLKIEEFSGEFFVNFSLVFRNDPAWVFFLLVNKKLWTYCHLSEIFVLWKFIMNADGWNSRCKDEGCLTWRDDEEDECGVKFSERKLKGVFVVIVLKKEKKRLKKSEKMLKDAEGVDSIVFGELLLYLTFWLFSFFQ